MCACGFQTIDRQCIGKRRIVDSGRRRGLYHWRVVLHATQSKIHAHGVPFLRVAWKRVPHSSCVGYPAAICLMAYAKQYF